jgi:hypothetical protein
MVQKYSWQKKQRSGEAFCNSPDPPGMFAISSSPIGETKFVKRIRISTEFAKPTTLACSPFSSL